MVHEGSGYAIGACEGRRAGEISPPEATITYRVYDLPQFPGKFRKALDRMGRSELKLR